MNKATFLFIGFLATFASAWFGLALIPAAHYTQVARAAPAGVMADVELIDRGRQVYMANGCIYCHSQQVSPSHFRSDQARGWGNRRTVAADYDNDKVALLGTMRTGPDLANIGVRNPSASWHYMHLYDPQLTSPGSIMPPFRFLFERRKATPGAPSPNVITLGGNPVQPDGTEIVPSDEARALIAYLLALNHGKVDRPEAFEPPAK